ncbi:MAG: hypothetical protein RKE49_14985 [Oceanicaulis sp.]
MSMQAETAFLVSEQETAALRARLREVRLAQYARLRGGFPIPLAGMVYWLVLAGLGHSLQLGDWASVAFFGSGAIFPLALVFSKLFNTPFMKDRSPVDSVLFPAFVSMLLFWCFIAASVSEAPSLVPLILAVGMSAHWPVIGWSYGRTALFTAHAVARSVLATVLWIAFPDERLTWLPLSVAAAYALTVIALWVDSARVRRSLAGASAAAPA